MSNASFFAALAGRNADNAAAWRVEAENLADALSAQNRTIANWEEAYENLQSSMDRTKEELLEWQKHYFIQRGVKELYAKLFFDENGKTPLQHYRDSEYSKEYIQRVFKEIVTNIISENGYANPWHNNEIPDLDLEEFKDSDHVEADYFKKSFLAVEALRRTYLSYFEDTYKKSFFEYFFEKHNVSNSKLNKLFDKLEKGILDNYKKVNLQKPDDISHIFNNWLELDNPNYIADKFAAERSDRMRIESSQKYDTNPSKTISKDIEYPKYLLVSLATVYVMEYIFKIFEGKNLMNSIVNVNCEKSTAEFERLYKFIISGLKHKLDTDVDISNINEEVKSMLNKFRSSSEEETKNDNVNYEQIDDSSAHFDEQASQEEFEENYSEDDDPNLESDLKSIEY